MTTPSTDDRPMAVRIQHERNQEPLSIIQLILLITLTSTGMLYLSADTLIIETGLGPKLKAILIALGGGLTSYTVLHFATTVGVELAGRGFLRAKVFSLLAILITGLGMFLATYSGWVLTDVATRQLQEHESALISHIQRHNEAALTAAQLHPALSLIADEQQASWECEIREGCLSNDNKGGNGPVAKELATLHKRSQGMANTFEEGQADYEDALALVNKHVGEYKESLSDNQLDIWSKRDALKSIHRDIEQSLSVMNQSLPILLVRAYANELQTGVNIASRYQATKRVNALLKRQGQSLNVIIDLFENDRVSPPPFPNRPGVTDTLRFIPSYASIAAIIFVIEIMLGLTLWVLLYLQVVWTREQLLPPSIQERREK